MQLILLYQRSNWLVSTIWLLYWHTREEVQTLATMLAGLSKITVRLTSLTARLLKINCITLSSLLNFRFGLQENGSSLMMTTQTFARRKIFWNYLEEVSDGLTQNEIDHFIADYNSFNADLFVYAGDWHMAYICLYKARVAESKS
jgi:hypothetical protein